MSIHVLIRNAFAIVFLICVAYAGQSQVSPNSQWSWRSGSNVVFQPVSRGPLGVPSVNYHPGSRAGATQFKDSNGNLWIYGGYDRSSSQTGNQAYSDLWFFNILTDEWTWVSGSSSMSASALYGEFRVPSATAYPGGRVDSYGWYDQRNNKLWLYGGAVYPDPTPFKNDLWSFDLTTHLWTWMSGSQGVNIPGFGSTFSSPDNTPGSRSKGAAWYVDNSINPLKASEPLPPRDCAKLYLAFGYGVNNFGQNSYLDDVWVYNTDDNNWMLLKVPEPIINGIQSTPLRRAGSAFWSRLEAPAGTSVDFLYCMGGAGQDRTAKYGFLNDIWKFDVRSNTWEFVTGSFYINPLSTETDPGGIYEMRADMGNTNQSVFLSGDGGISNSLWHLNLNTLLWERYWHNGSMFSPNFGVRYGQAATIRPRNISDNFWFAKNRVYAFADGSVFAAFDPCTSASVTTSDYSIYPGDQINLRCAATGNTPTYQWQIDGTDILGATSSTYLATPPNYFQRYRCVVKAGASCASNIKIVNISDEVAIEASTPLISINDVSVNETQGVANLTVRLSRVLDHAIKINFTTVDGTAIGKAVGGSKNIDYKSTKGYITIPALTYTAIISVPIVPDALIEEQEYFDVQLSIAKNAREEITDGTGRVTILDGPAPLVASVRPKSIPQSNIQGEIFRVKASPNPTTDAFRLIVETSSKEKISIRITDITGRIVKEINSSIPSQILFFGDEFKRGIYFVQVSQLEKRQTLKLIKL